MMVTKALIRHEPAVVAPSPRASSPGGAHDSEDFLRSHAKRVRRLKINASAWLVGVTLLTALWMRHEWAANGAFETVGFSGQEGQWNPTLWAVGVGLWTLVVGIMALGVHFHRSGARTRGAQVRYHVAAWSLGMILLTPIWLLIEWQDNGAFERWSGDSQPGSWDPWILAVAGIWAVSAGLLMAVRVMRDRRTPAR